MNYGPITAITSIPYSEWRQRLDCLSSWAGEQELPLIVDDRYELVRFLENAIFREERRCLFCYRDRLEKSAAVARKGNFEAFTTTLLYSRFQQHDTIRELGEETRPPLRRALPLPGFSLRLAGGYQALQRAGPVSAAVLRLHLQRRRTLPGPEKTLPRAADPQKKKPAPLPARAFYLKVVKIVATVIIKGDHLFGPGFLVFKRFGRAGSAAGLAGTRAGRRVTTPFFAAAACNLRGCRPLKQSFFSPLPGCRR